MKQIIKYITYSIFIFLIILVTQRKKVEAYDFENLIDITYSVESDEYMHIKEKRTIKNNSSKYFIKADSFEVFIVPTFKTRSDSNKQDLSEVAKTIKVTDLSGTSLNYQSEIKEDMIEIKVQYGSDLNKNNQKVIIFEYDNYELVEKIGKVKNIYLPGMSPDFEKETTSENGAITKTSFTVSLEVDKNLGKPNFVLPDPKNTIEGTDITTYNFESSSLINQAVWVQIGNEQNYYFEITQSVKTAENLSSKVFYTFYDLTLPRENENGNQKIYFESIYPDPEYVKYDGEKNIISRFKFENNIETEIVVKGFIVTNSTNLIKREEAGDLSDYDYSKLYAVIDNDEVDYKNLLQGAVYWEVDEDEIKFKAEELAKDKTNVLDILLSDYNFIIENVDYDNLKTGTNNQRQGALKTLQGGSSVCMEYSDLLITLLRVQGIPARAAFGYGFDPKASFESTEGHQWVEVYTPKIGWIPVDPTWGDTGRRNYIGSDVDHALWRVASKNVETPSPITKYSILDNSELTPPTFKIKAVESIENTNLMSLEEFLNKYKYSKKTEIIEKVDQLNDYGKAIFIGIPIMLSLVIIFSLVGLINRLLFKKNDNIRYEDANPKV